MIDKTIFENYLTELNRKQYEGIPLSFIEKGKNIPLINKYNSKITIDSISEEVDLAFNILIELLKEKEIVINHKEKTEYDEHPEMMKEYESDNLKIIAKINLFNQLEYSKINILINFKEEKQILPISEVLLGFANGISLDLSIFKMDNQFRKSFNVSMLTTSRYNIFKNEPLKEKIEVCSLPSNSIPEIERIFDKNLSELNKNILLLYCKKAFGINVNEIGQKTKFKLLNKKYLLNEKSNLEQKYKEDINYTNYEDFIELLRLKEDNTLDKNELIKFYKLVKEEQSELNKKLINKIKV